MSRKRTGIVFCLWPAMILAASGALRGQEAGSSRNPVAQQALSHLTGTLERPLFVPGRRKLAPPAPVLSFEAPPPQLLAPPSVVLLGILKSANVTLAVLRTGGSEKVMHVGIGDDVGGWKVAEIAARHVTLSLDDRTASVTLFQNQAEKPLAGNERNGRGQQPDDTP